jgi:hypothetical protein
MSNLMTGVPVCYYALGKWQAKLFKKLGWMLLMKEKIAAAEKVGNTKYKKFYECKVNAYINSIVANCDAIENKKMEIKNANANVGDSKKTFKDLDLEILCTNIGLLLTIAKKSLSTDDTILIGGARRSKRSSKKSSKKSAKQK